MATAAVALSVRGTTGSVRAVRKGLVYWGCLWTAGQVVWDVQVALGFGQAPTPGDLILLASVLPMNMAAAPAASLTAEGGVFSQMALSSLAGRAVAATAVHSASGVGAAGSLGGLVAEADPAAATIIVIPVLED